ncbi:hypothetical protein [Spiroplasma endosymbiont of Panzeria rudis]|uniref:hypothetical protein n=1 Tax=Spiroplasma endosymbiont of Panzeria rudis TaxID=3066301 RepID=UPI0030D4EC4E
MKKILTLMGTIAFGSGIVTPVLACSDQQQDSILKAITNGNGNYNGWEATLSKVGIKKPVDVPIDGQRPEKEQVIKNEALENSLAQSLAKLILDKANIKEPTWFDSQLEVGTKCYYFTIDNGKIDELTKSRTWDVDASTGRISINITCQVGVVNNDKSFKVEQYIKKTFNIKCSYTQSDYIVYSCVSDVTKLSEQIVPISVDEKTKPDIDKTYADFSQKTKTLVQEGISLALNNNPHVNSVNINIKGIDGQKVTSSGPNKLELKVNFVISFQDSLIDMSLPSPYDDSNYVPTILQFNS